VPDLDRLLNAIDAEEEQSYGSDNEGDLASERARNIDRYLGKNVLPAPEGRSQVRDRSVYETIQWMQPSLSRIFGGDAVVELPPVSPEDVEPAKQETEYLNHIILQKNNWFEIFDTASKDALLTKAGYLYVYSEKRRQIEIEKYERQTPESLALIMQDQPEVVSQKEYPDPDYQPEPQPVPGPDGQPLLGPDGQPLMVMPPPPMLYDVEVRRTKQETKFCIKALPPERCKVSQMAENVQLRGCPYFEYYDFCTLSELRELGYEVEDDVASGDSADTLEDAARNQFKSTEWGETNSLDPAMKRVKCRWVWIKYDYDEDGIAEMQLAVIVGKNIIHREECNNIPVAVLCPDKLPHRHIGLCPADAVCDLEEIITAILRQGLDNLYFANNPLKYADARYVNLDDMLVSRPGATIRLKAGAIFGQNFGVMPIPDVFPQAMQAMEYMAALKRNRVGVDNSFQGLDASQLTQLQPGTVNQISSMASQRVEQVARHYANGIVEMCALLHEVILKAGHKKDVVQLRGKWVTVDPSTWRKRSDFRISVGYAAGNKDAQISRLMMIGNMQKEAMAGGLSIVTERNIFETMNELIKASDMQSPERFITDPEKAPKKGPPQPDVTVVAGEQIRAQAQIQAKQLDVAQKERDSQRDYDIKLKELRFDAANAQLDIAKHKDTARRERESAHFGVQKDEHMARVQAELNPKNIEAQAKATESQAATEILKAVQESNAQQTQAILTAMQELSKALSAPRVIDRDPKSGRATGSRIAQ
jgi:hypothetical protein